MIDCNEWKTENCHECANMGKVKRLELRWQLYRTSLPVRDLENFRPMDFCSTECTYIIHCCIPMATLSSFLLLSMTCSSTIHVELVSCFSVATVVTQMRHDVHCPYIVCLVAGYFLHYVTCRLTKWFYVIEVHYYFLFF